MKTPLRSRILIHSLVLSLSLVCATGRAGTLASNIDQPLISGTQSLNAAVTGLAQAFKTTITNTTVTSVTVNAGLGSTATTLGIYSTTGSGTSRRPDVQVATVVTGTVLEPDTYTFSSLSIDLAPDTEYWLVLAGTAGSWGYNSSSFGSGPGYLSDNTDLALGTWHPPVSTGPYRLDIQAVPEPAGLALVVVPVGAGAWFITRRRPRRSRPSA